MAKKKQTHFENVALAPMPERFRRWAEALRGFKRSKRDTYEYVEVPVAMAEALANQLEDDACELDDA